MIPLVSNSQTESGNVHSHNGTGYCPHCMREVIYQFMVLDDKISTQDVGYICNSCKTPLLSVRRERISRKLVRRYIDPKLEAHVQFMAQSKMTNPRHEEVEAQLLKVGKKGEIYG